MQRKQEAAGTTREIEEAPASPHERTGMLCEQWAQASSRNPTGWRKQTGLRECAKTSIQDTSRVRVPLKNAD